jgi:hypothetical protein
MLCGKNQARRPTEGTQPPIGVQRQLDPDSSTNGQSAIRQQSRSLDTSKSVLESRETFYSPPPREKILIRESSPTVISTRLSYALNIPLDITPPLSRNKQSRRLKVRRPLNPTTNLLKIEDCER